MLHFIVGSVATAQCLCDAYRYSRTEEGVGFPGSTSRYWFAVYYKLLRVSALESLKVLGYDKLLTLSLF